MSGPATLDDLLDYLQRSTPLRRSELVRLVADVLTYFGETPEDFVRRRHGELQAQGLANPETFRQIGRELEARRFRAPSLTERQIRRAVYG